MGEKFFNNSGIFHLSKVFKGPVVRVAGIF
jgi:hypothetical protein